MSKTARLPVNSWNDSVRTAKTIQSRNQDEAGRTVLDARSHLRFLVRDLIGEQRGRGGKFVLELLWKAATWHDAAITQLGNDSSAHRVPSLRGHGMADQ